MCVCCVCTEQCVLIEQLVCVCVVCVWCVCVDLTVCGLLYSVCVWCACGVCVWT